MKESFRLNRHLVDGDKTYDCWVLSKQRFDRTNREEVQQLFLQSLEKIKRI
jgi:hypothetical protein